MMRRVTRIPLLLAPAVSQIGRANRTVIALLLVSGCSNLAQEAPGKAPFAGATWSLVNIVSMDDTTYTPAPDAEYSITFGSDGRASVIGDCNRGNADWVLREPAGVEFGPMATTRAFCGPESLADRFFRDLGYVRSFVIRDGRLYLATMADGAILEFRRD